jgi:Ca2+-binding RTX toxin-like protein
MLDLRGLFSRINYQGTNPVTDGFVSLNSANGDTQVMFDSDGAGTRAATLVATIQGVSPSSLVMQSDWYFSGTAGPTPPPPPAVSSGLFTLPTSGDGIDTVPVVSSPYTAPDGVENLILSGQFAQNVTGNSLNNIITSNNYASTINGGAGNDIIIAGESWDVLTGGAGRDIFVFDSLPWNYARVTDFTDGTDMIDLRQIFTAHNYQGTNPVADGYISFQSNGAGGTQIYFDQDGWGSAHQWGYLIVTLDNVSPSSLHMQTDWFFH